ncbi:hypothetical protein BaRGS_00019083 [Batillaria attramentaria]|uniref:Uncharacterized protein n=1 Tax=Batillaria attramentaria TaxID=370345 RepID=A0ABD0KRW1_9CAEN
MAAHTGTPLSLSGHLLILSVFFIITVPYSYGGSYGILPMKRWTLPDNTVNSSAIENAVDTDTLSCVALTGTRPTIDILFERRDNTGRPTSIRTVVLYIPTYESNAYKADGLQLKVSVHREFSMSHTFTAGANMGYVWDGTGETDWVRIGLRQQRYSSSTSITLTLCEVKVYGA